MNFKMWLEDGTATPGVDVADPKIQALQKQLGPAAASMVQKAKGKINPAQALNTVVAKQLAQGNVAATKVNPPAGGIEPPSMMKKKSKKK